MNNIVATIKSQHIVLPITTGVYDVFCVLIFDTVNITIEGLSIVNWK